MSIATTDHSGETASPNVEHAAPSQRVQSIDVLRGFDMFWISGGDHFFDALAVATSWIWAIFISRQLAHSVWAGFSFFQTFFQTRIIVIECTFE
ncbi:MAG: hypothetical protein ABI651_13225, partial [Verrucomicrobiota bacterium]